MIRSAARLGGQLLEQCNCFVGAFGRHEQMIVEVGRDRIDAYPVAASRVVIAAMKPTASSDEWMSSVTMRQRKVAASPALRAASSRDDQRQALALPKHHQRIDAGRNAVRHRREDEDVGRQASAASSRAVFEGSS